MPFYRAPYLYESGNDTVPALHAYFLISWDRYRYRYRCGYHMVFEASLLSRDP